MYICDCSSTSRLFFKRGFWEQNKKHIIAILIISLVCAIFLMCQCLIFFGAAYNNRERNHNVAFICADLDGQGAGAALIDLCEQLINISDPTKPTPYILNNVTTYQEVVSATLTKPFWGALIARENATANLQQVLATANATGYDAAASFTVLYVEGRNQPVASVILVYLTALVTTLEYKASENFWSNAFLMGTYNASELVALTPVIVRPLFHSIVNLAPTNPVGQLAQQLGIMYLAIFSFIFLMTILAHLRPILSKMRFFFTRVLIIYSMVLFGSFMISLGFSSAVVIYSAVPNYNFVPYWLLNWLQQSVYMSFLVPWVPLVKEKLALVLGLFIIFNISAAFYALEIQQQFYYWGYATPFRHAVTATRYILFGGYNELSTNIPVLVGMLIFNFILIFISMYCNKHFLVPLGYGLPPVDMNDHETDKGIRKRNKESAMEAGTVNDDGETNAVQLQVADGNDAKK